MTKLGIIGAMEIEVAILKSKLENARGTKVGPMEFFEGTLSPAFRRTNLISMGKFVRIIHKLASPVGTPRTAFPTDQSG